MAFYHPGVGDTETMRVSGAPLNMPPLSSDFALGPMDILAHLYSCLLPLDEAWLLLTHYMVDSGIVRPHLEGLLPEFTSWLVTSWLCDFGQVT